MQTGFDAARAWLAGSPFVTRLGIRAVEVADGVVRLALPWAPDLATLGDLVHGGAVATLIDTAATAAAWASPGPPPSRGTTVGLAVSYVSGAHASDLVATARVLRRGKSLCFLDVEVHDAAGTLVAKATATYKLG